MGAYSSKPETDTVTEEGSNGKLSFGASAMRGWRLTQEDAHVALLDFDNEAQVKSHLFAVFDGHGGAEVAQFAAQSLPTWIKKIPAFKEGDVADALTQAFLTFDQHLTESSVIEQLKALAGDEKSEDEDEQINEAIMLKEEADMPIEQLIAKYNRKTQPAESGTKIETVNSESHEPVAGGSGMSSSSSSSKAAVANDDEQSPAPQTSESSQSKVKESSSNGDTGSSSNGDVSHPPNGVAADPGTGNGSTSNEADSKVKENGDDVKNDESKSEVKEPEPAKFVGKGKQKKVIIPKPKRKVEPAAAYQQFLEDADSEDDSDDDEEAFGPASDSDDDDLEAADDGEDDDEEEDSDSSDEDDEEEVDGLFFNPAGDFEEPGKDSGCTAVVALIRDKTLFVANAGDSRCVVSCGGKAIEMSEDHKPEDERELTRIEKAGGKVTLDGRVNGGLNLSRALGDHTYKNNPNLPLKDQMISPEPDVKQITLTPEHEFMILACDGIWNSMTSQEVVDFVRGRLDQMKPAKICEELFHHCLAPDTSGDGTGCDNMTAIIVTFDESVRQTHKRRMDPVDEVLPKKGRDEEETPANE